MFKLLKYLSALLGFIVLALLALPFFIDINNYKPEISAAIYDNTGRNINIGHIDLSVFPWVGISLKNIHLQNDPSFKHPFLLAAASIDIQLELAPLFNSEYKVKSFIVDRPKVWLERKENNSNNWDNEQRNNTDPAQATLPIPPASKSVISNNPIALNAKLLQVRNGQVVWSDANTGEFTLSDIELNIKDLQLDQPIGITLAAKLQGNPFNLKASVGPIGDLNDFNPQKLPVLVQLQSEQFNLAPFKQWLPEFNQEQVTMFGDLQSAYTSFNISVEQHTDNTILSSGSLQAQLKDTFNATWKVNSHNIKTLNIQELKLDINDTHALQISGKIKNLNTTPRFEIRAETPTLQRIWLNQFIPGLQELYSSHPKPWQNIKLGTLIAGDQDIIDIRDLQLQLDGEPVQASGNIALGSAPDIQLRLSTNILHLDPWIPQENSSTSIATVSPALPSDNNSISIPEEDTEPNLTFLRPWYLSLQLQAKTIHAKQLQWDNLRLTLSAEKGVVRLNPLSFDIEGGHVVENFTLYANRHPATWNESIRMSGVPVHPILKSLADFDKLSGVAQLSTDFSGKGLLPKSIKQSMSGNGHFLFEDGQFKGLDIAKEVRKLRGSDANTQNSTDFAQMQGNFRVNRGVLTNNDLYMASPLFRLTGKGQVNLEPLRLDYRVRPRLIKSLAGQGGSQVQQGVVIPLHISGPLDDLSIAVEVDKKSLIESTAAINNATGRKIGGVAGQVLDKGFIDTREEQKQKARAKIEAEKTRLQAQAEEKAKEKLKNAFENFNF